MKSQTQFFVIVGLIIVIFGIAWFSFSTRNQEVAQFFPATINRDCAPWDGSAFTMSIPMSAEVVINISIYQSPDIKLPVAFSFPDETTRVGNALLLLPVGLPEQLTGKVWFQGVEQRAPVAGEFELITQAGRTFNGKFKAEWGNEIVYCG